MDPLPFSSGLWWWKWCEILAALCNDAGVSFLTGRKRVRMIRRSTKLSPYCFLHGLGQLFLLPIVRESVEWIGQRVSLFLVNTRWILFASWKLFGQKSWVKWPRKKKSSSLGNKKVNIHFFFREMVTMIRFWKVIIRDEFIFLWIPVANPFLVIHFHILWFHLFDCSIQNHYNGTRVITVRPFISIVLLV